MKIPEITRDPKRIMLACMALAPFIVATLYMTFKEAPTRLKRTHGGSISTPATPQTTPQAPKK